jgi:hypothetical protein
MDVGRVIVDGPLVVGHVSAIGLPVRLCCEDNAALVRCIGTGQVYYQEMH